MKLLVTRWRPARCSRAHLLFVLLLLAIYLATLVFFHVELDVTSAQPDAVPRQAQHDRVVSERTSAELRHPWLPQREDRRKRAWNNGSTYVQTTVRRLERCADVLEIPVVNDSAAEDRLFSSWPPRIFNRRPIDVVSPTLPWCSDLQDDPDPTPRHDAVDDDEESSSFRSVAGGHYVYSAYYDDREQSGSVVRVMALLRTASATPPTPTLFCHVEASSSSGDWPVASKLLRMMMMMRSSHGYHTAPLRYYEMCENHGKDYGGWILTCPLPRGLRRPPCRLLISSSETVDLLDAVSVPVFSTRPAAGPDSAPVRF